MAVFRIERTRDYTVMSNHHLRNANLSLKAKGLLSMMLSLPEDWNYTTRGLAKICKEGVDAIGAALRELEAAGYIVRHKLRDRQGRISDTEYVIYEQPQPKNPDTPQPDMASPDTENPYLDIYTFNASLKRRLEDFSRKYPLLCRLERSTPEGSETYVLDKSRLSIRLVPPYSEERLAAARECAKEHGFQVIQTEEKIA